MYLIISFVCALISLILFILLKDKKKNWHLNILPIIFGSATLMWLIDAIFAATKGEDFFSFNAKSMYIALATFIIGILIYFIILLVCYYRNKLKNNKEKLKKIE